MVKQPDGGTEQSRSDENADMKSIATPSGLSQRGRLAFLFRDSALYGGAAAVSSASALITFPVLARHFSTADYGVLDFFMVLASFLWILFVFGQDSGVARFFYEHDDVDGRRQLISQSLVFQMVGCFLLVPVLWVGASWIGPLLSRAEQATELLRIILLQMPFLLLINFSQNLLKWTFSRKKFLIVSLGYVIVKSLLFVGIVLIFNADVRDVLLTALACSVVFGLIGLWCIRSWFIRPAGFARLLEMLPFALPCGLICLLTALSPAIERVLTERSLGAEALGLYAVGSKIALITSLASGAFQTAWGPFYLSIHKQGDAAATYNWVLKIFALGLCMLSFTLSMLAYPAVSVLASERYAGAAVLVFPLSMGLAVTAIGWITEIGILISKRSYLSLYGHTLSIVVLLVCAFFLAPILGLLGIGFAVLLGQAARAVCSSFLAQRACPLPWDYKPVLTVLLFSLAWGVAGSFAGQAYSPYAALVFFAGGLILLPAVSWKTLFSKTERCRIIGMLRAWVQRIKTKAMCSADGDMPAPDKEGP